MTTAARPKEKSAAALRRELERRTASRANIVAETDQTRAKAESAAETGETSARVRLQNRLVALEGLQEQEDRLIDRLKEQLAEAEVGEKRQALRRQLPALARQAAEKRDLYYARMGELNTALGLAFTELVEIDQVPYASRQRFFEVLESLTGERILGRVTDREYPATLALVAELEAEGVDLSAVLEQRGRTEPSNIDRHVERQPIEPFGWLIGQGMVAVQAAEALRSQHRERGED
jgi:hypothetical protein